MPPRGLRPYVPGDPVTLLAVPQGPPLTVLFLGPYRGCLLHWFQNRTRPCAGDGLCPTEWHKVSPIWYAFAPVELFRPELNEWVPYVLEVTAHLAEHLSGHDLRGEEWELKRRAGKGKAAAVDGRCLGKEDSLTLAPCWDVKPVLLAWWNVAEIDLGQPNPAPPKVYLPTSGRRPPRASAQSNPEPARRPFVPRRPAVDPASEAAELGALLGGIVGRLGERSAVSTSPPDVPADGDSSRNGAH